MRRVFGNACDFTRLQNTTLFTNPLFGLALEHVNDFFAAGMDVEAMRAAGRKGRAYQKDLFGADNFGIGHPFHVAPWEVVVLDVGGGDKVSRHALTEGWSTFQFVAEY